MMELQKPIDLIKRSSWFDLLLVGLIFTPASMLAWMELISFVGVGVSRRGYWVVFLVLMHFAAVALMIWGSLQYRRRYRTMSLIVGYLMSKGFVMVSFEQIRKKYGDEFTGEYLLEVIKEFPQYLCIAKLKDNRTGVARLTEKVPHGIPQNLSED